MTQSLEINHIVWQEIRIEIRYCKQWSSSNIDGHNVTYLEIEAIEPKRARLPMTETGYRSHFCQNAHILEHGGAVDFAKKWLDSEAQSHDWQVYFEKSKQPDLFELYKSFL